MVYAFGADSEWELDEELWELRYRGERVRTQPKILALLFHLARNGRRVVSSDELLRELWPAEVVTRSSLARAVSMARSLLAERGNGESFIETVPRRGYRFRGIATVAGARDGEAEPLVGRESLLAELRSEYAAASAGAGRVAVLRGDAGIGKTRLIEEIGRHARGAPAAVLLSWCSSDSGQPPLWPWARIAREALELGPALGRRLGARIAAVRELAGPTTAGERSERPAGSDSELGAGSELFRLVDGLVALLRALAAERPLVIALDDLQWADRISLRVLELCARDLVASRVFLVAALRDDGLASQAPLQACLAALERLAQTRTRRLEPLPRSETATLIGRLWGDEPPPREVVDAIWGAGLGNPLFTRELVRHVRAGGVGLLPATVRILLEGRLARLSAGARELLSVAALAGAEPSLELVRAVVAGDPPAFARASAELAELGLAASASGAPRRLRFAHPLVRETVISGQGARERLCLHERIARELERRGAADPDSIASEVAEHRLAIARDGGDGAGAADWAERAAAVALRRCAYDDAASGFASALDALRLAAAPDSRRELALLLALGDAHARANQLTAGAEAAEAAAALARRLDDPDGLARAALLVFVRGPESGGPYDRVLKLLQEAEERSRNTRTRMRARITARLAHELFFTPGTIERRVALADEARALAADDANIETRLFVGYHTLIGTWSRVRARERAAITAQLTALADEARDPAARFMVSAPFLASLLECGRADEADAEIETLARRVEALEVPSFFGWYPHVYRGMRALLDGRLDAAERLMADGLELGLRAHTQDALRNHAGQFAQLLHERGRDAESEATARAMRTRFAAISVWRAGLIRTLTCVGKREEARADLRAWLGQGLPDPHDDTNGVISLLLLAEAAADLGEVAAAGDLFARLEAYSGEHAAPAFGAVYLGPVDLPLGRLAAVLGRREPALALLEAAERASERMGARPMLARARLARAEVLVAHARARELAQGRALAAAAAALADSLGMPEVSHRAREVSER